jgi:hypothetical protein
MIARIGFVAAFALAVSFISSATAQVIYSPVRYQYSTDHGATFYYGGDCPALLALAQHPDCLPLRLRTFGYIPLPRPQRDFISKHPFDTTPVVYADCRLDAADALTVSDASNEAYARVPLYFRKADLVPPTAVKAITPPPPAQTPAPSPHARIEIHPYIPTPPAVPFDGPPHTQPAPSPTTRPASDKSADFNK